MKDKQTQEIFDFLETCSDTDINFISLLINYAKDLKQFQSEYSISDAEMAKLMNMSKSDIQKIQKGAYNVDLGHIAKLRVLYADEMAKSKAAIKLASETEK